MSKLKLGVFFGGQSSEYSVSLHSAASFLRQIHKENYDITMVGITQQGQFYVYTGDIDAIEHDQWHDEDHCTPCYFKYKGLVTGNGEHIDLDCVFLVLHGKNGEDGTMQGMLEVLNIRYVGCDVLSSAMAMDKEIMHILCDEANIPCAPYVCLKANQPQPSFEQIQEKIALPWIVKPCNAGSSYGVSKVSTKEEFEVACKEAFHYDGRGKILVEKTIEGFEIGCAVMGNETIFTGSVDEIEINGGFFDFEGKYELKGANIYCPARISEKTFKEAQDLARRSYLALNCMGMARVDMFVCKDGSVILNELNTIPGLTATSRYPSMMKEAGIEFADLIDRLIELAMQREVGVC